MPAPELSDPMELQCAGLGPGTCGGWGVLTKASCLSLAEVRAMLWSRTLSSPHLAQVTAWLGWEVGVSN